MKKHFLATVAVGILLATAGCSASSTAPAPSVTPTKDSLSGSVTVFAAASLTKTFGELAAKFEAAHPGVTVTTSFAGSADLVAQITAGAPADVFASADEKNMAKVADPAPEPQIFAGNTLVIAVPTGNPGKVQSIADLARVTTVLCAAEVPCGAASQTLLSNAGVTVTPASAEQNVTAVLTKVAAGEADAGLVYATDVVGREDVASIVPEGADAVVNRYPIAALADAPNPAAAAAFVDFVLSADGQKILADAGFRAP